MKTEEEIDRMREKRERKRKVERQEELKHFHEM